FLIQKTEWTTSYPRQVLAWLSVLSGAALLLVQYYHSMSTHPNFYSVRVTITSAIVLIWVITSPLQLKRALRLLLKPFLLFAPISYALYVIHYPLLRFGHDISAGNELLLLLLFPLILLCAAVLEIKLQPIINIYWRTFHSYKAA